MPFSETDTLAVSDHVEPVAVDPADADAAAASTDANSADSSAVDDQDAKTPDLLSVLKAAVAPEPADPSPAVSDEVVADPAAEADPADAVDPDAALPFHDHPRWKEVIAERDSFREDASQYGKITQFMDVHGLASVEVAEGFEIMALLKSGDPTKLAQTRDWFSSRLDLLDSMLGNVLPDDLQDKVEQGLIDEDAAQETARLRAADKLRTDRAAAATVAADEETAATERTASVGRVVSAVEAWEARIKASDPDYSKKAELVETTCQAIVQRTGKAPLTEAEAVALADQALAEVNKRLAAMLPTKRPLSATPHGSSTPTSAEPKTLKEAIRGAVAR